MANSDILILYPEIANAATRMQPSNGFSLATNEQTNYPGINSTRGARWQVWQSASNATGHFMNFDMGPYATKTVDFLVASKLNLLRSLGTTIQLWVRHSSDDTTYTNDIALADIDALTLYGPNSDDYVQLFTRTASFRYWHIGFAAGAAFANQIGKLYIGNRFDMGVELDDYTINREIVKTSYLETAAGATLIGRSDVPRYTVRLEWYGVSDAKIETFFQEVYSRRFTTPVFLHTQNYHDVLDNHRLLHCALVSAETENRDHKANFNTLTTDWVELIG